MGRHRWYGLSYFYMKEFIKSRTRFQWMIAGFWVIMAIMFALVGDFKGLIYNLGIFIVMVYLSYKFG